MVAQKLTAALLFLAASFAPSPAHGASSILTVCHSIAKEISSSSSVYYPGSSNYGFDVSHWSNLSSHSAVCSVEPGSAADLRVLGKSRAPFAIKGGGHTTNPGFSSTNGVQISMTRFSNVVYDASSQTVEIGSGLVWGDVYAALEPHSVNVVGGRVATVGVAGLILGGGMSYNTNQYGLSIDNVVAYELVLPNGKVTTVTSKDEDLFWGLKGGFDNFGVVTKFTMKAYPQTEVWGGTIFVLPDSLDAANDGIAQFSANVTDPKAAIESAFTYYAGQVVLTIIIFYDAPMPPPGLFDGFLSIPGATQSLSTRSFLSMAHATSSDPGAPNVLFNGPQVKRVTKPLLQAIVNETKFWGDALTPYSASGLNIVPETFLPSIFSHGQHSAYPPERLAGLSPINMMFGWNDSSPAVQERFHDALVQSAAQLASVAAQDGQDSTDAAVYTNYALYGAPVGNYVRGKCKEVEEDQASV
ncbi:hypothetical protein EVG20_g3432 [Dentipellis fragilis]|uniref:FAD-binding PCMH-type domain-containing protein n=1 Tax=Dentipellis fragilis TaxID=205917 RepID=A0A4Y9Z2M0_9AGAM|nr:hypothetical protein EVG20_g3432 [Dentipellis fragilis]